MLYLITLMFVMSVSFIGAITICWLDFKRANNPKCYCTVCSVKPVVNSSRHEAIRKRHGLKGGK